jgi:hypothetical protein
MQWLRHVWNHGIEKILDVDFSDTILEDWYSIEKRRQGDPSWQAIQRHIAYQNWEMYANHDYDYYSSDDECILIEQAG